MRPWQPLWRSEIPAHERQTAREAFERAGAVYEPPDEVWVNDEYQCFVTYLGPKGRAGAVQLSIKRNDKRPAHDWRELQAVKNEVLGPEREALELYPAESRLVDMADQTWLWAMPAGVQIPLGFNEGPKLDGPEDDAHRAKTGKGSQRPRRPGIPTGVR